MRLYDDLAWLWPLLSPPQDYAPEAALVRAMLHEHFGEENSEARRSIVEFGAGGGHTLHHLANEFDAVAVDLSEPMLANCRVLNPGMETVVGDMRTLRLGRAFDAVLIHDAIDYMTSEADVAAALTTAAAHLKPGGLAIIAPTYLRETFVDRELATDQTEDQDGRGVTYFSYVSDPDPQDDVFELILVYLIHDAHDAPVRIEHDRHRCGLFDAETWQHLMHDAGFNVEPRQEDLSQDSAWTLFLGVKR